MRDIKHLTIWLLILAPLCLGIIKDANLPSCTDNNRATVYETILDSKIARLLWIDGTTTVFALTEGNHLWLSNDGGTSWTDQSPYMTGSTTKFGSKSGVASFVPPRSDPLTVYFIGFGGYLWQTTDAGKSYKFRQPSGNFYIDSLSVFEAHPSERDWALVDGPSPRCANNSASGTCYRILWLTRDGGSTWMNLDTYVYQFTWGNAGLFGVNINSIWVLHWTTKSGKQSSKSLYDLEFAYSSDLMGTYSNKIEDVIFMLHHNNNTFIAQKASSSSSVSMLVSEDNGQTFNPINFPYNLPESRYIILDYGGSPLVWIAVVHGSGSWAHVYSAAGNGSDYSMSIPYVQIAPNGNPYFTRVRGLSGWYMANQIQNVGQGLRGDGTATMITHDNGGVWQTLPGPIMNSGDAIDCDDTDVNCTLNLHLEVKPELGVQNSYPISIWGGIESTRHAIGRMVATGNYGSRLDNTDDNQFTYFTRDAGWTWYQVAEGNNLYDLTDHGALGMWLDYSDTTANVYYTWDEFYSTVGCQFTNTPMQVTNIFVDPEEKPEAFTLHGYRTAAGGKVSGVIVHIDFTNLNERSCTDSDYELWSPYDSITDSEHCELGAQVNYRRRRRLADCYMGDQEEQSNPVPCPCVREDFECDVCYELIQGFCQLMDECTDSTINCTNGRLKHPTGYRRIPGDICEGGVDLSATYEECGEPVVSGQSSPHKNVGAGVTVLIVFLVIGLLGAAAGTLWYLNKKKNLFQFKSFSPLPMSAMYENGELSTALDDDLIEQREAEPIDEEEIENSFSKKRDEDEESLI